MQYLYGDSSISPFTSNFLEFLRDSIDFSVYVIEAEERITSTRDRTDVRRIKAHAGVEEIEELGRTVVATIETTALRMADSPAFECASRMSTVCEEAVRAAATGVRERLASDIAQAQADEAAERQGCLQALLGLLAPHVPPESSLVRHVRLTESGSYEAVLEGVCVPLGLSWRRQVEIGEGHRFKHVARVENLQRRLEVGAPDVTGWIKKQVTVRPQHLERHVITEVIQEGSQIVLRLRTEPGSEDGYDIRRDGETGRVTASRLVAGPNQAAAGPFDVDEEDAPKLLELCNAVEAHLSELTTTRAFEAKVGDTDFAALPSFVEFMKRLVGFLSPMVHEIAKHSLEPDELVLRRQLADNRREEIFVSKTTLREKYEKLPGELCALFAPLKLTATLSRSMPPAAPAPGSVTRSELPPSNPPPPPTKPIAAIAPAMPPLPTFAPAVDPPNGRSSTPNVSATPSTSKTPGVSTTPNVSTAPKVSTSATVSATPSVNATPSMAGAPKAAPKPNPAPKPEAQPRPEPLIPMRTVLEKIVELDRKSGQPETHRECANLLEGTMFARYSPEDQRRVVQLLLVLETRATVSDERLRALRAARDRARALIERLHDPVDYELLGLCQVALDESAAAGETFRQGLEVASVRDAQSDLCGRFRRHVAALQ